MTGDLRPLCIVASAIAGRRVAVAAAEPGRRSWTDGRTIFLEPAEDPRARLRLLGVQASLIAAGSLRPELVQELGRSRSLAARYLAVEGHRALGANEAVLPSWMRPMIDHRLAGAVASPQESLALARRTRRLEPAWDFGTIDARRVRTSSGPGSRSPATLIPGQTSLVELEDADDPGGVDLGDLLSSPVGGGSAVGRLLARLLRPTRGRSAGGPPGADAPTHVAGARPLAGGTLVSLPTRGSALDGVEPAQPAKHSYPEWDEQRGTYRPDWCQVTEAVAEPDLGSTSTLTDPIALRHALARLGTGLTPCRRRRQGDDLDIDAIVEARVDHRTGTHASDGLYIENLRCRRDLSVLVLLDVSGSAAEPGVAGRSVHEHQREAAAMLTTVLHRLGDRVALYAFSSRGRTAVQVTKVSGFDEPVDGWTSRRLDGLRPGAYTRLGAAIRHGATLLATHGGTPRRLLVVLSDGLAYDHGYEGRYGEADAQRALLEARRQGVGCLCLSVGADVEAGALQRVFGTTAHAAVPTADHLPATVGPLFAAALRAADAQRRGFQRTERTRVRLLVDRRSA